MYKFPTRNYFILTLLSLSLMGCSPFETKNSTVSTSTNNPSTGAVQNDPNSGLGMVPPNVLNIPGLPIPNGVLVSLADTVIVGGDEVWSGQVVMTSEKYQPVQLVEYMRTNMPQYGWVETAIVRSRRTSITFINKERYATVRIQPLGKSGSEIDIVVSPSGQVMAQNNRATAQQPIESYPVQPVIIDQQPQ